MPETVEIRMAKASKEDIAHVRNLMQVIDHWMEHGTVVVGDDDMEIDEERFVGLLRTAWSNRAELSWFRVVEGCDTLIANCCDPDKTYLAFKPELAKALAEAS